MYGHAESAQQSILADSQLDSVHGTPGMITIYGEETLDSPAPQKVHKQAASSHGHCQVDILCWLCVLL